MEFMAELPALEQYKIENIAHRLTGASFYGAPIADALTGVPMMSAHMQPRRGFCHGRLKAPQSTHMAGRK